MFTEVPIGDNYFWRVYLTGSYTPECSPNYVKAEHFDTYKENISKLHTYTTTISQFLKDHPGKYTHFVLLDHQDWMAHYAPEMLTEEWELILKNSAPGAKILLRSASPKVSFLPQFVLDRLETEKVMTAELHPKDRVGTYGSVLFAEIKPEVSLKKTETEIPAPVNEAMIPN